MQIISETNYNKLQKTLREKKKENIVFASSNDDLSRKVLEKDEIAVLLINLAGRRDFMKQRNSGFNHVMAKLAKKKNVIIGINLDEIIESSPREKAQILARISQNIMLCNKNKLRMKFIGQKHKRDIYDLRALGLVLGMPTWMTKLLKNE